MCVYVCVYAHISTLLKIGLGARDVAHLESEALNIIKLSIQCQAPDKQDMADYTYNPRTWR